MLDAGGVQAGAHRGRELARLSGEAVGADASRRTIPVLFGPEVEEPGGVCDMAHPSGTGALGRNESFRLEAGKDAVRQTDRDVRLLGESLDLPFVVGPEEQRLCCDAGFPRESGRCLHALRIMPSVPGWLEMQEQARELDVGVAETVDDGDTVVPEDLARLRRCRSRNEEQMAVRVGLGLMHELPGGRRVGVLLDLDCDRLGDPGEPENGVAPPAPVRRAKRLDRHAGDVT